MRRFVPVLMALALLLAGGDAADARRFRFMSAMPVEGAFEHVVKVLDLPDAPEFATGNGKFFDLGYLKRSDGTGEWVGWVGSPSRYIPLGPESLKFIMDKAGLKQLPPGPGTPVDWKTSARNADPRLLAGLLIAVLMSLGIVSAMRRPSRRLKIELPKPEPTEGQGGGSAWMKKAHASVNAAAPPMESPLIRAARDRAERLRQQAPAVRGQIAKSPELLNRPDFGRQGIGRR